jgi:hypothetical protein
MTHPIYVSWAKHAGQGHLMAKAMISVLRPYKSCSRGYLKNKGFWGLCGGEAAVQTPDYHF